MASEDCAPTGSIDKSSGAVAAKGDVPLVLSVRLLNSKLSARVRVCRRTWLVLGLDQSVCGDAEAWRFTGYGDWGTGLVFPSGLSHAAGAGGRHAYATLACGICAAASPLSCFQLQAMPLLPQDTQYDTAAPSAVQVWRVASGHLLVRPLINGVEAGYMLLDTGASGFVVAPDAVEQLGLDTFGELFASSMSGKIASTFAKARTWSLGPLTMQDPVMMTMDVSGLVQGAPGPLIGIVGFDLFRRAVVELPQMSGATSPDMATASTMSGLPLITPRSPFDLQPGLAEEASGEQSGSESDSDGGTASSSSRDSPGSDSDGSSSDSTGRPSSKAPGKAARRMRSGGAGGTGSAPRAGGEGGRVGGWPGGSDVFEMHIHHPDTYSAEQGAAWEWFPISMIGSLPHVHTTVHSSPGAAAPASVGAQPVLLMLDTGACGADIMLHSRAVGELQLAGSSAGSGNSFVRGVGGQGGDAVRVQRVEVAALAMASVHFTHIKALSLAVSSIDMSQYSSGIMCGDLVTRLPLALDYARKRIGVPTAMARRSTVRGSGG